MLGTCPGPGGSLLHSPRCGCEHRCVSRQQGRQREKGAGAHSCRGTLLQVARPQEPSGRCPQCPSELTRFCWAEAVPGFLRAQGHEGRCRRPHARAGTGGGSGSARPLAIALEPRREGELLARLRAAREGGKGKGRHPPAVAAEGDAALPLEHAGGSVLPGRCGRGDSGDGTVAAERGRPERCRGGDPSTPPSAAPARQRMHTRTHHKKKSFPLLFVATDFSQPHAVNIVFLLVAGPPRAAGLSHGRRVAHKHRVLRLPQALRPDPEGRCWQRGGLPLPPCPRNGSAAGTAPDWLPIGEPPLTPPVPLGGHPLKASNLNKQNLHHFISHGKQMPLSQSPARHLPLAPMQLPVASSGSPAAL